MTPLIDGRAFGAIFDCAAEAIFLADDQGRYVQTNPAAEKLTLYSGRELATMTVFDLTPSQDKTRALVMWGDFIRQGALSGEYTLTRKDGSPVEVEFQAVANIIPGVHLSIIRDVSARKREERRLRRAMQLQEGTAGLSAAVDTEQVAQAIVAAGMAALDAQAGHVVVVVDGGRSAEVLATVGMQPDHEAQWAEAFRSYGAAPQMVEGRYRFPLDVPTLLVEIFQGGEPMRVKQVADVAGLPTSRGITELGAAMLCLPLVLRGALVGGLYLFWNERSALCEDESFCAATLASLSAQALERARLFTAEKAARERAVASEKTVLEYQERMQRLAFDRFVVEDRERRRVTTAFHDGVTQYLALAKMKLAPVRRTLGGAERTAVDAAVKLITEAIDETRSLSFELSPPFLYDLGINAALSWLAETLERDAGMRIEIVEEGKDVSLDDVTASIVFRTVRELLMNVVKHAHTTTAKVSIRHCAEHLEVVVEDAGAGFDAAEMASYTGFGLASVREQIGRLGGAVDVTTGRNQGTHVRVLVPRRPNPAPA